MLLKDFPIILKRHFWHNLSHTPPLHYKIKMILALEKVRYMIVFNFIAVHLDVCNKSILMLFLALIYSYIFLFLFHAAIPFSIYFYAPSKPYEPIKNEKHREIKTNSAAISLCLFRPLLLSEYNKKQFLLQR